MLTMRCPQVCCAYTYRLSRRHSTTCLIAFFFVILVTIFHLYSRNHYGHSHREHLIGDFNYTPGAFLKGLHPNSTNFCKFNYGLPRTLNWSSLKVNGSPELGFKSQYRVIYNAIESLTYSNTSKSEFVTYVTHATPEFVYHIVEIARYWDGPISLSVFVPDYDLDIAMQILQQLCHCYDGMSKVAVHLFYPKTFPPNLKRQVIKTRTTTPPTLTEDPEEVLRRKLENYKRLTGDARAEYVQKAIQNKIKKMLIPPIHRRTRAPKLMFKDCSGTRYSPHNIPTFRKQYKMLYPINVGRNSARNASKTIYFLVSDIELVPSDKLAPKFLNMLEKLFGSKSKIIPKTVYVVPLFEVANGEDIPRDKETLVEMVAENRAMYFHQKSCSHCQRFPGLQTWLKRSPPDGLELMMIARREYPYHRWEPLYFGTNREPWYSEILSWEGLQDKMTQMLELCLQKYRMVILDGGFLCHAASPPTRNKVKTPHAENVNEIRYTKIISEFRKKYKPSTKCKVNYGVDLRPIYDIVK